MSYHGKHAFEFDRYHPRVRTAVVIARIAVLFALTCLVATFVMLVY